MGIFQNLKAMRRQKVVLRATKNPLRPRNKLSHAPDAVSREYRGKIAICKEYFTPRLSFRTKSRNLSFECKITEILTQNHARNSLGGLEFCKAGLIFTLSLILCASCSYSFGVRPSSRLGGPLIFEFVDVENRPLQPTLAFPNFRTDFGRALAASLETRRASVARKCNHLRTGVRRP